MKLICHWDYPGSVWLNDGAKNKTVGACGLFSDLTVRILWGVERNVRGSRIESLICAH